MSRPEWTLPRTAAPEPLGMRVRSNSVDTVPDSAQQVLADAAAAEITRALVVGGLAFAGIVLLALVVVYRTAKARWQQQQDEEQDGNDMW